MILNTSGAVDGSDKLLTNLNNPKLCGIEKVTLMYSVIKSIKYKEGSVKWSSVCGSLTVLGKIHFAQF